MASQRELRSVRQGGVGQVKAMGHEAETTAAVPQGVREAELQTTARRSVGLDSGGQGSCRDMDGYKTEG